MKLTPVFLLLYFPSTETGGRRGADAASGSDRQPDCHDAGYPGPQPVLLQRSPDD